ncbi:MAG: chitosanase [Patescibacteria group bacterium]|nr:chitosanase [Patescibacteria group bacterium]
MLKLAMLQSTVLAAVMIIAPVGSVAIGPGSLVKGSGSAVYYVADDDERHAFPNQSVYSSWYQTSSQSIITLDDNPLAELALGENVTFRPGSTLVKVATDPKVYAVSRYSVLHWVITEGLAAALYGQSWNKRIVDVPDVFFNDYTVGAPITKVADYDMQKELAAARTPQDNVQSNSSATDGWLMPNQKRRAEQLTTVFENGAPEFDYGYVENLDDGRGYTVGRVGFTTATSDAYLVVERYAELAPHSPLTSYLPRLKELADNEDSSVDGLSGFPQAWLAAAEDPILRAVQDAITDELYYVPAMQTSDDLGLQYALSRAVIYDTIIQHGGGDGPDSLSAIVVRTNQAAGGNPKSGIDEKSWLNNFLATRREDLINPSDSSTKDVWATSAGRVDVLQSIAGAGNYDLNGPIAIVSQDYNATIN